MLILSLWLLHHRTTSHYHSCYNGQVSVPEWGVNTTHPTSREQAGTRAIIWVYFSTLIFFIAHITRTDQVILGFSTSTSFATASNQLDREYNDQFNQFTHITPLPINCSLHVKGTHAPHWLKGNKVFPFHLAIKSLQIDLGYEFVSVCKYNLLHVRTQV